MIFSPIFPVLWATKNEPRFFNLPASEGLTKGSGTHLRFCPTKPNLLYKNKYEIGHGQKKVVLGRPSIRLWKNIGLIGAFICLFTAGGRAQSTDFTGRIPDSRGQLHIFHGDWRFISGVSGTIAFDDNIFIAPADERADFLFQIKPAFALGLGDFWNQLNFISEQTDANPTLTAERDDSKRNYAYASYSPTASIFARTRSSDALDHDLKLTAFQRHARTDLGEHLQFQTDSSPNSEVGGRVKTTSYTGLIDGKYDYTEKLEIDEELSFARISYSAGLGSKEAQTTTALMYNVAPKTSLGEEITAGYVWPDAGSNQWFVRPALRMTFAPKEKLRVTAFVGEDLRRIQGDKSTRGTFVFEVAGSYEVNLNRSISISAQKQIRTSARYSGQNLLVTTYQGELKQLLFQSYHITISAGRSSEALQQNVQVVSRSDTLYVAGILVSRKTGRRSRIELSYLRNRNASSDATYRFIRNNLGLNYIYVF